MKLLLHTIIYTSTAYTLHIHIIQAQQITSEMRATMRSGRDTNLENDIVSSQIKEIGYTVLFHVRNNKPYLTRAYVKTKRF